MLLGRGRQLRGSGDDLRNYYYDLSQLPELLKPAADRLAVKEVVPLGVHHVEDVAEPRPQGGRQEGSDLASDGHATGVYPAVPPESLESPLSPRLSLRLYARASALGARYG